MNVSEEKLNSILEEINKPNGEGDFTDEDLRIVSEIFSKALFYKMWEFQEEADIKIDVRMKRAKRTAKELRELVKKTTGVEL